MSTTTALLSASLAALALAIPAQAQDERAAATPATVTYESYEVVQPTGDEPVYEDLTEEVYADETYVDPAPDHRAWRALPARQNAYPTIMPDTVVTSGGQPLGYSPEQCANWLADCRKAYLGDQGSDYCEAYLTRYEHGGMSGYPVGAYPVMMVPMQTTRRVPPREIVHEEWVDAE